MSKKIQLVTTSLVDSLGFDFQERRRDRNFDAAKSMTRFTVMLTLIFITGWYTLWAR